MLALARRANWPGHCQDCGVEKELSQILEALSRERRGKMWRPERELRNAIVAWTTSAQSKGATWREMSATLGINMEKLKWWQRASLADKVPSAMADGHAMLRRVEVGTSHGEPAQNSAGLTVLLIRGASASEVIAMVRAL
jgi:hypothetical protein